MAHRVPFRRRRIGQERAEDEPRPQYLLGVESDEPEPILSEAGRRWIEVAVRFSDRNRDGILCPQNQDDILLVEWLPFSSGEGGEWWFHCPTCKAENFALVRHPEEP